MIDYRIPLSIGEVTDHLGNRYSTVLYGDKLLGAVRDWRPSYREYWGPQTRTSDLILTLTEIPQAAPGRPKRKWSTAMGLRRPR